jgi:predicted polyphosphate/ATP-dependent NAD kinase
LEVASAPGPIGLVVNPMSGRDVRRLVGRAQTETPESKRSQLQRAVVGAAAAGAERFLWVPDLFRVSERALEYLRVGAKLERLEIGAIRTRPEDTIRAVRAMRDAGCAALLVLGGDGTNRLVAQATSFPSTWRRRWPGPRPGWSLPAGCPWPRSPSAPSWCASATPTAPRAWR